jgi:hypothetical protein
MQREGKEVHKTPAPEPKVESMCSSKASSTAFIALKKKWQ